MHQNRFLLCSAAAVFALAVACSKSSPSPASPTSTENISGSAAADGSTLKATAPNPVSPVNGEQPDTVVLVASKSTGKFADIPLSYQFQIRSGSSVVYDSGVVGGAASGANNVQFTPAVALTPDTAYTWRARAAYQGAMGPWGADGSFKSPLGGYLRGNELFDPLVGGRTVGTLGGAAQLTSDGVFLPDHFSWVRYELQQTLVQGEFSMMIKGLVVESPGTQGAKSKVFSMQEGGGSITTDDYRATIEFRGKQYPTPGAVTFRIITGDAVNRVFDGPRKVVGGWDRNKWYFWRFSWVTGRATLEVREGSETGPVKYLESTGTGSHEYRPTPHVLYLGAPDARGGADDMTAAPITIKSVWASSNSRPPFPQ
jgi:hypothetical protein